MCFGWVDAGCFCESGDEIGEYSFEDDAGYVLSDSFFEEFGFGEALFEEGCCGAFLWCECIAAKQEVELSQLAVIIGGCDCVECVPEVCFVVCGSAWSRSVVV